MRTLYYIIILSLAVCFADCKNKGGEVVTDNLPVLDIEAAIDNRRPFSLDSIVSKIEIIQLDGSDKRSLIDNYIYQIGESKSRYYIMDNPNGPVKVFDKTGKFISTRGVLGRGPGEFVRVLGLAVDGKKDNVYLLARTGGGNNGIIAYDAEGRLFARVDSVGSARSISYHDGQLIALSELSYSRDKRVAKYTFVDVFSPDLRHQGSIETSFKGYGTLYSLTAPTLPSGASSRHISDILYSNNGKNLIVKEGRSDTVFHYKADGGLVPAFKLEMGRFAIPPGEITEEEIDKGFAVSDIYETDNYFFVDGAYRKEQSPGVSIIEAERMVFDKSDLANGFAIPGQGQNSRNGVKSLGGITFHPVYSRANKLVGAFMALQLIRAKERNDITNSDLKAIAESIGEDGNPVLVVVTLD